MTAVETWLYFLSLLSSRDLVVTAKCDPQKKATRPVRDTDSE